MKTWVTWVSLVLVMSLAISAKIPAGTQKIDARFTGPVALQGNPATDASVVIIASGSGQAKKLGALNSVDVRWNVDSDVVMGLLSGTLAETPLNSGTLEVAAETGDVVSGTFTGTVKKRGRWFFEIAGQYTLTSGTGSLSGISGAGDIKGTLDIRSRDYDGTIDGNFTLP